MGQFKVNTEPIVHVSVEDDGSPIPGTWTVGYKLHRGNEGLEVAETAPDDSGLRLAALKAASVQGQPAFDAIASGYWPLYAARPLLHRQAVRIAFQRLRV